MLAPTSKSEPTAGASMVTVGGSFTGAVTVMSSASDAVAPSSSVTVSQAV